MPFSHSASLYIICCFRFYFSYFSEFYLTVPSLLRQIVFMRASQGIYKSDDQDFQNILNLLVYSASFFLSLFFFFLFFYYYYLTSYFLIIAFLFYARYYKIQFLSMPYICRFYKNYFTSSSLDNPNAFLNFFFSFLYFLFYFYSLVFRETFNIYFSPSQSDDCIRTLALTSYYDQTDYYDECGLIASFQSFIQSYCLSYLPLFDLLESMYLFNSFFFFYY